jgi:hypothetical protein
VLSDGKEPLKTGFVLDADLVTSMVKKLAVGQLSVQ